MLSTLLGTKIGMTATYDSRGRRVGATLVEITPHHIRLRKKFLKETDRRRLSRSE